MISDVLAGALLVAGAAMVALGGLGLVRFPDVFTRMHAATKAATVGVIGTTAAAALEAGAPRGAFVLLLVITLLFLSGPLGMSLLARAAFHDPETPRATATRELARPPSVPESTSARRSRGTGWALGAWLLLVWVAVFGSIRPNVIAGGVVVAGLASVALRRLAPGWPRALTRPAAVIRFVLYFGRQVLVATWDVAMTLRVPPGELRPVIVEVPMRAVTRSEVALVMNAVSFTPGTVALEIHDDRLFVHVLSRHPADATVADLMELQERIAEVFGIDQVLEIT